MDIKKFGTFSAIVALCTLAACSDDSSSSNAADQPNIELLAECTMPAFLKKGDKVALISPSYTTPDSNIQKTADVIKEWGFTPVIGKNVDKLDAGKYAGTELELEGKKFLIMRQSDVVAVLC